MRAKKLEGLLPGWKFDFIDTDVPFYSGNRIFRSLAFRYKVGPLVQTINRYILSNLSSDRYNLIWIDKGVYLDQSTMSALRRRATTIIHYTPDTAFFGNRSRLFYAGANRYDYLVTTKSFEIENYRRLVPDEKIILTTQGFDNDIHQPQTSFQNKINRVAFVGLWEPSREKIIQYLLDNEIKVALAGFNWDNFVRKNSGNSFLEFHAKALWDQQYARFISASLFSIGLVSKQFPELHTTRTFEIPACGTALVTEGNVETRSFYTETEAIFYDDNGQLVEKIKYFQRNASELEKLTANGYKRVIEAGFDYESILRRILSRVLAGCSHEALQFKVE